MCVQINMVSHQFIIDRGENGSQSRPIIFDSCTKDGYGVESEGGGSNYEYLKVMSTKARDPTRDGWIKEFIKRK